jgi:hypothetical protein
MDNYLPIHKEDEFSFLEKPLSHIKRSLGTTIESSKYRWKIFAAALIIVLLSIFTALVFFSHSHHTKSTSKGRFSPCGNSPEQAVDAGCTFDPLTFQWLPKSCPRDVTEDWENYNNGTAWRYWRDEHGQEEIEGDYTSLATQIGNGEYWTTSGEHVTHCTYMLLRYHIAASRGDLTDPSTRSPTHAHHCVGYILRMARQSPEWNKISSLGDIGYGSCARH